MKIEMLLKSDNNYGYFTWRRLFVDDDNFAEFLLDRKMFQTKFLAIN